MIFHVATCMYEYINVRTYKYCHRWKVDMAVEVEIRFGYPSCEAQQTSRLKYFVCGEILRQLMHAREEQILFASLRARDRFCHSRSRRC